MGRRIADAVPRPAQRNDLPEAGGELLPPDGGFYGSAPTAGKPPRWPWLAHLLRLLGETDKPSPDEPRRPPNPIRHPQPPKEINA
uniref:hypothetical protein n=1 Tax=Nonomuraea sp. CA-252377 TaxID=3240003 RepID=UPI003F490C39